MSETLSRRRIARGRARTRVDIINSLCRKVGVCRRDSSSQYLTKTEWLKLSEAFDAGQQALEREQEQQQDNASS